MRARWVVGSALVGTALSLLLASVFDDQDQAARLHLAGAPRVRSAQRAQVARQVSASDVALAAPPRNEVAASGSPDAGQSSSGLDALNAAFAADDRWARRAAIEAVVDMGNPGAIPVLAATDVRTDGYVGAAVIDGLGRLARATKDPSLRARATDRLVEIVRDGRDAADGAALADTLLAVEALGVADDPTAARPLSEELTRGALPTSVLVEIVKALGVLGDRSSVDAIRAFRERLIATRSDDDFEEQLRLEAISAAQEAEIALGG